MPRTSKDKRDRTGGLHPTLSDGDHLDVVCDGRILRIHFQGKNGYGLYQISCVGDKDYFKLTSSRVKKEGAANERAK